MSSKATIEKVTNLCKRRGFIFANSEIYGGNNGFWDYGPLGVKMRRAIEQLWWNYMVEYRDNVVGQDSTIISHPRVWDASGHTAQFADHMIDNKDSNKRYRVDNLLDIQEEGINAKLAEALNCPNDSEQLEMALVERAAEAPEILKEAGVICPVSGTGVWTQPRQFNLMMQTYVGPVFDEDHKAYLRPETCQPIFTNFAAIQTATRQKLPFGIAQTGKAFRNEINPRNFIFRSREFTQMELEFFCHEEEAMDWYNYWAEQRQKFYFEELKFSPDKIRFHDHPENKLAHYAKAAQDIEFEFPFGWGELEGIHHRGNFDLTQHSEFAGEKLTYFDQQRNERYTPTCIETSVGLDRMMLAILCHAYDEDTAATQKEGKDEDVRTVLRFPAVIAPVQVAILPLSKKLTDQATPVLEKLRKSFRTEMDVTQAIGKRYRRFDEIGAPFCVTVDFETAEDNCVTVRERDSMSQERISLDELQNYLNTKING